MKVTEESVRRAIKVFLDEVKIPWPGHWYRMDRETLMRHQEELFEKCVSAFMAALQELEEPCPTCDTLAHDSDIEAQVMHLTDKVNELVDVVNRFRSKIDPDDTMEEVLEYLRTNHMAFGLATLRWPDAVDKLLKSGLIHVDAEGFVRVEPGARI